MQSHNNNNNNNRKVQFEHFYWRVLSLKKVTEEAEALSIPLWIERSMTTQLAQVANSAVSMPKMKAKSFIVSYWGLALSSVVPFSLATAISTSGSCFVTEAEIELKLWSMTRRLQHTASQFYSRGYSSKSATASEAKFRFLLIRLDSRSHSRCSAAFNHCCSLFEHTESFPTEEDIEHADEQK